MLLTLFLTLYMNFMQIGLNFLGNFGLFDLPCSKNQNFCVKIPLILYGESDRIGQK
jgi:hypothetical protein